MPLRDLYADSLPPNNLPPQRLVVVLPAFNEEKSVTRVIQQIRDHLEFDGDVDVLVIDDGSEDQTSEVAARASATVFRHRRNEGLGVAIATGMELAVRNGADIIVTMDSDGQFKGEHISEIIAPILAGRAEMVIGSRYLRPEYIPPDTPKWKMAMSWVLCKIVSYVIWGKRLTDVTCGFRAYTRSAALRLNFLTRFTYTVESIIDASWKGVAIAEVPVRCRTIREHGKSRITSNFAKYLREIGVIVLRRMRDSRPLFFYFMLATVFIVLAVASTVGVSAVWPYPETRVEAVFVTGISVAVLATLTAASFLADQVLTALRYLHTIMRMTRVTEYNVADVKGLLSQWPLSGRLDDSLFLRGNYTHPRANETGRNFFEPPTDSDSVASSESSVTPGLGSHRS